MRLARSRMFGPVMRFLGSIAVVAVLASGSAQAADALMPTKAPPFVAAYNWSGLYVGGHLGAAFTRADYFKTTAIPSPLDKKGGGSRTGWTAGAGMEYALWNNWAVRLEYDYLDFGSRTFAMNNIASGAFAENATVRLKAHEVKLGLNYLFNPGNFNPIVLPAGQTKQTEPEPQRLGLPAPLDFTAVSDL